ncbi:MAG TPA: histidine phosphatase family protein [Longilinea sp.]|nr:histidine phosphatase family protein [Longilinea sp.]
MKTLLLMRHAKSSWKFPELSDRDRPLNKRGEKDAPRMGKLLKEKELIPDRIYSSTAVRACKTAEAVAEKVDYKNEIIYLDSLYMAEPAAIVDVLKTVPDDAKCVLLVGHNPGMEGLVQILSHKVESLPTAAVAYIKLPIKSWSEFSLAVEGELKAVRRPREK